MPGRGHAREPPICVQIPVCWGAVSSALHRLFCAFVRFGDSRWQDWLGLCARVFLDRLRPVPASGRRSLVVMPIRSGLFLPLFDELADPAVVARLSVEAEQAGWHGVFVWDHVRWHEPVLAVADPWITLAAVATATGRIRLGPMVTPGRQVPGLQAGQPRPPRPARPDRGRPQRAAPGPAPPRSRTTSSPSSRPAATPPRTLRPVPAGGSASFPPRGSPRTWYGQ